MQTNDVRLIVTDLDGTFLGDGGILFEQNGAAFREASRQGIAIAIATGRMAPVAAHMASTLGMHRCTLIGLNGGQVWDSPAPVHIEQHVFPTSLSHAILDIIREHHCRGNAYSEDTFYSTQRYSTEAGERFKKSYSEAGIRIINHDSALDLAYDAPLLKMLVRDTGDTQAYLACKEAIGALPGVYLASSFAHNFEIMQKGISKAEAVSHLAASLGISMSQVMAFGDYDNDLPLLSQCGYSVAMGNALPEVKDTCRFLTKTNEECGVAYGIHALLNNQLDLIRKPV